VGERLSPPGIDPGVDAELIGEVLALSAGASRAPLPRHRHGLTREQVLTAQRARILVATAQVVTEVGYAAASTRAIIGRAGVSSKSFYALYADKEAAFFAAFTLLDGLVLHAVRRPLETADPRRTLRQGVEAFLRTLAGWPLITRMHAVEARAAGPRVLAHRTAIYAELVGALRQAVAAAAQTDPAISVPSDAVLMAVVGGIGELVLQHVVAHDAAALPELAPDVVDLIERVCGAR
jgi:AcrR family transcriptional regulator